MFFIFFFTVSSETIRLFSQYEPDARYELNQMLVYIPKVIKELHQGNLQPFDDWIGLGIDHHRPVSMTYFLCTDRGRSCSSRAKAQRGNERVVLNILSLVLRCTGLEYVQD